MVSLKEQQHHRAKINRLLKKITDHERTGKPLDFDEEEIDTIERGLLCHHAVICLDIKKRTGAKK